MQPLRAAVPVHNIMPCQCFCAAVSSHLEAGYDAVVEIKHKAVFLQHPLPLLLRQPVRRPVDSSGDALLQLAGDCLVLEHGSAGPFRQRHGLARHPSDDLPACRAAYMGGGGDTEPAC